MSRKKAEKIKNKRQKLDNRSLDGINHAIHNADAWLGISRSYIWSSHDNFILLLTYQFSNFIFVSHWPCGHWNQKESLFCDCFFFLILYFSVLIKNINILMKINNLYNVLVSGPSIKCILKVKIDEWICWV